MYAMISDGRGGFDAAQLRSSVVGQDDAAMVENGTGEADTIVGKTGNDSPSDGDGFDTIDGAGGDDLIDGERGNDLLYGGRGNDGTSGGGGLDRISGGSGADVIYGGGGNDRTLRGADDDIITGGAGRDRFIFGADDGDDIVTDYSITDRDASKASHDFVLLTDEDTE